MEIRQEVSDVGSPSFGDTNSPSFTSRETETTVVVQSRESVLIGGIIDERIERIRNGVRWLVRAGAPWRLLPNDLPPCQPYSIPLRGLYGLVRVCW